MRRCLITCALLLAGCSNEVRVQPIVPPDLLRGCPGYTGPAPEIERHVIAALAAEKRGRECANRRIEAIAEIVSPNRD